MSTTCAMVENVISHNFSILQRDPHSWRWILMATTLTTPTTVYFLERPHPHPCKWIWKQLPLLPQLPSIFQRDPTPTLAGESDSLPPLTAKTSCFFNRQIVRQMTDKNQLFNHKTQEIDIVEEIQINLWSFKVVFNLSTCPVLIENWLLFLQGHQVGC